MAGVIILMIAFHSCDQRKAAMFVEKKLIPDKVITELDDSTYFKIMRSLVFDNGRLYCAEENRSQILILDENLNIRNVVGSLGRGPSEMSYIGCLAVCEDTIIVSDAGSNRMQFYLNNGQHIKSENTGYEDYLLPSYRFIYKKGVYIGEAKNSEKSIVVYNSTSDKVNYFGDRYRFSSVMQEKIRNHRFLLDGGDYIVSISNNIPIIEKYEPETGKLLSSLDLSDVEPIKSRIEESEMENLPENSYMSFLSDCNIFDDKIYLLCCKNIDSYYVNDIIVLNSRDGLEITSKYSLPDEIYSSIAINGKYLFAFCTDTCELQRFEL